MKRLLIVVALLALSIPAIAADKWWDFYNRGVTAVRSKNYEVGAEALQRALAEMPNESGSARARNEIITYVPHFWLGIAKFNLGDVDGALREWRTSEEQGVVQSTQYYSQLRDWVARAQSQKQRNSENAAADSKREASVAVGRAVSAQMDAVAAGADRSDRYRAAQRKLQEAMESLATAGTDIRAYRRAADIAQQANDLFATAAGEAKQQRAARPPAVVRQQPQAPPLVVMPQPPAPAIEPMPEKVETVAPPVKTDVIAKIESVRMQLQLAYRTFAGGDLAVSEQLLTRMLDEQKSGEAYLLRGCVRYTRSMLARQSDMRGATSDFRTALKLNRALRLDKSAFSPKLVAFFEQVKKSSS